MRTREEVLKSKAALFADMDVPRVTKKEPWTSIVEKVKSSEEHTALVVDESNRLIGLITDQDIITALSRPDLAEKLQHNQVAAEDVMTALDIEKDTVAKSSDPLEDVISKLQGSNILKRRLKIVPVVDKSGAPIGQVTRASIQKSLDELLEE
jgi:CBS domain-containing protein